MFFAEEAQEVRCYEFGAADVNFLQNSATTISLVFLCVCVCLRERESDQGG